LVKPLSRAYLRRLGKDVETQPVVSLLSSPAYLKSSLLLP